MLFDLASYIDHTILKETTTIFDVERLCAEAVSEKFMAVCIPAKFVGAAKAMLLSSAVKTATVIAFPSGKGHWAEKVNEIDRVLGNGADEVDMVINLDDLKAGNLHNLECEIVACLGPVRSANKVIKVIVESGLLTDAELLTCCKLYGSHEIDFLKTSTGFAKVGATVSAVKLMRASLPAHIGIKAAGGIRSWVFAKELIEAGAARLGCSAGLQIMKEYKEEQNMT